MQSVQGLSPPTMSSMTPKTRGAAASPAGIFAAVLQSQMGTAGELHFSAHAQQRLSARNIQLSPAEIGQVSTAIEGLANKGGRDALLLLDKAALIVNVPNRTVVTAVGTGELSNSVFTNIDSAVVIPPVRDSLEL